MLGKVIHCLCPLPVYCVLDREPQRRQVTRHEAMGAVSIFCAHNYSTTNLNPLECGTRDARHNVCGRFAWKQLYYAHHDCTNVRKLGDTAYEQKKRFSSYLRAFASMRMRIYASTPTHRKAQKDSLLAHLR